ncbi:hypothetical protein ACRALDRAFT_2102267 [Sodiomyces alcalophilus JCM 7366]|uniref:uncharacterized protein n=1 Tax=Sodiomyces alcalophilus JCM 7366 TaxID=591952 RepID=UPI0039B4FA60
MASTARSQSRLLSHGIRAAESSSDPESDSDSSTTEEHAAAVVKSPTKLYYNIENLSADLQARVREAFKDPPRLTLQYCRLQDDVYAFQMTELVPRSIRIGAPDSKFPNPKCSCAQEGGNPCRHLLWLLDQIVDQTLGDENSGAPLTMTPAGYPPEVGDPFASITDLHLDILADGLHCELVRPDSDDHANGLNPCRVQEARERLASVAAVPTEEYRPDIFDRPTLGTNLIKRHDLECTVFRMLLDNSDFFHYFLSLTRSSDPARDPFRKLEHRVQSVLRHLDEYSASRSESSRAHRPSSADRPRDVTWAARRILAVVSRIKAKIFRRDSPLAPWERTSAARALVRILASVVDRNCESYLGTGPQVERNLYTRLIGDARGGDFVLGVLLLLPDAAAPFLHELEVIAETIGVHGAPAAYAEKLDMLLARLKKPASGGSIGASKRHGPYDAQGSHDRGSKRVK